MHNLPKTDPCREVEDQPLDETGRQGEAGNLGVADTKLLPVEAGGGREVVAGSRVTAAAAACSWVAANAGCSWVAADAGCSWVAADAGCSWVVADAGCSWVVADAGCSLKATAQAFEGKFAAVTSSAGQLAARGAGPDVAAAASSCFQAAAFQNEQESYFPFHSKNFQLLLPQFSDSSSVSCYLLSAEQCCGDLDPWPLQVPEQGLLQPQLGPDPAIRNIDI